MSIISKALATGNSKTYYSVENEFVAHGTLFTNSDMFYVAAHPTLGLWVCGSTANNVPVTIGFVNWSNINRIIVDDKNDLVFIVVNNYDEVINNADLSFRKMYKGAFTHTMKSEEKGVEEKALQLPKDLFSGNIIPYLQQRCNVSSQQVEGVSSFWSWVYLIVIIIVIAIAIFA